MSDTLGKIKAVLNACGAWNNDAAWQVQGTWCIKHKALEIVAAYKGIKFDPPTIIEDNALERVSLIVTGHMDERTEWSIGECSAQNYKAFTNEKMAAYPWAMAEKRAKDRVILKLVGLHGYAYSEDEADDFKVGQKAEPPMPPEKIAEGIVKGIGKCETLHDLQTYWVDMQDDVKALPEDQKKRVTTEKDRRKEALIKEQEAVTP